VCQRLACVRVLLREVGQAVGYLLGRGASDRGSLLMIGQQDRQPARRTSPDFSGDPHARTGQVDRLNFQPMPLAQVGNPLTKVL